MDMPLQPGQVIPAFALPDLHGVLLKRTAYRGRAGLLLVFLPPRDEDTARYAADLRAVVDGWGRDQAALLIVRDAAELEQLGPGGAARLLVDADAAVRGQFLPAGAPGGWFVTDRYGELYSQGVAYTTAELPPPADFAEWLRFVGMRCGG